MVHCSLIAFLLCIVGIVYGEEFDNRLQLDKVYTVSWKIENPDIIFQVEAQTHGWVGLGFAPGTTMMGADLVIGGVKGGNAYLWDRHGVGNAYPPMDDKQDYEPISGIENSTHTILKFKRKLDTGDKDDWKFDSRPVYLLWGFNPSDAIDANNMTIHTDHGNSDAVTIISSTTHSPSSPPPGAGPKPSTADYPYHATLDHAGAFQLFWKFDEETITFQLHARTKGWAGLGFSPNGGMGGADMVVLWVDQSGKGFISDRHADHNDFPPEDAKQDYTLTSSAKNDTHLIMTFSRKRNTCDPDDWVFTDDTTRVIYGSNDAIPESKDKFKIHSVKSSRSVHFFDKKIGSEEGPPADKSAMPIEIRVNEVHIPDNRSTTYWCEVLAAPRVTKKLHIVKVEPVIDQQNLDVVHHIIIYVCSKNMSSWIGKGRSCFEADEETELPAFSECKNQVLAGWAVGGQSYSYPDDIGMPLYNDAEDMYVLMEMHYDNSQMKKGKVDSSGMRVWVTEKLRPIEGGQFAIGLPPMADQQVIPPGVKEFTSYGYCTPECTEGFPKDGIKVFGGLLHTHLAGRKVRLSHFRKGKQLPPALSDEHYDFNYQDNRHLSEPITILPGDQLVVECVYGTLDRNKTTFGGHGTHDEMCLVFVEYYPTLYRGFGCFSSADKREMFKMFGINFAPFNQSDPTNTSVILPNGGHKELSNYLKEDFNFNWTPEKIEQFQKASRDARQDVICLREGLNNKQGRNFTKNANGTIEGLDFYVQHGYPNITEPLVVSDVCIDKKGTAPVSKSQDNGETRGNRPAPQELRERNAGDKAHKNNLISLILISIIGALIYA